MTNKLSAKLGSLLAVCIPILLALSVFTPNLDFGLPKISYGIDLVGGGQIVLQIDEKAVEEKELNTLRNLLEKSHQQDMENSSLTSLVFKGDNLPNATKEAIMNNYPAVSMTETPMGLVLNGFPSYVKTKVGEAVVENITVLRTRLNALGVADISVYRQGSDKVVVEIPHGNQMDRIKSILASSAEVGFYEAAEKGVTLSYKESTVVRSAEPIISGKSIKQAVATIDQQSGMPVVSIRVDNESGKLMGKFTRENIGKPIITTLTDSDYKDGVRNITESVVNVATVNGEFSNSFMISGIGSLEKSDNLALILRSGAMSVPMYVVSESTIDSRLGADNAKQGFMAFAIGLLALAMYVVSIYRVRGLFAILTLIVNASLIVISLSAMGASLTLTGLAGIILTMGMAVDANIIVIERERELFGKTPTPLLNSFKSSALPILDANATTLLVAVILYNVSSVSLKGFAITLALGVICTVISSYVINMYFSTSWVKERTKEDIEGDVTPAVNKVL